LQRCPVGQLAAPRGYVPGVSQERHRFTPSIAHAASRLATAGCRRRCVDALQTSLATGPRAYVARCETLAYDAKFEREAGEPFRIARRGATALHSGISRRGAPS
jgi:hypothetical protein